MRMLRFCCRVWKHRQSRRSRNPAARVRGRRERDRPRKGQHPAAARDRSFRSHGSAAQGAGRRNSSGEAGGYGPGSGSQTDRREERLEGQAISVGLSRKRSGGVARTSGCASLNDVRDIRLYGIVRIGDIAALGEGTLRKGPFVRQECPLRRVRDVSRLGARHGHRSAVRTDQSENSSHPRVRPQRQIGGKSSKRVQTGEPSSLLPKVPQSDAIRTIERRHKAEPVTRRIDRKSVV